MRHQDKIILGLWILTIIACNPRKDKLTEYNIPSCDSLASLNAPQKSKDSCSLADIVTIEVEENSGEESGLIVKNKSFYPFKKYNFGHKNWSLDYEIEKQICGLFGVDSCWGKNSFHFEGNKLIQLQNIPFAKLKHKDYNHEPGIHGFNFSLKNNGKEELNFQVSIGADLGYLNLNDTAFYVTDEGLMFLFVKYDW